MKGRVLVICLGLAVAMAAASTGAVAQAIMLELSPWDGPYYGEVIEVMSGDVEMLWVHLYDPEPGATWLVDGFCEIRYELEPPEGPEEPQGTVTPLDFHIGPGSYLQEGVWYPFATIKVEGTPCTTLRIWGNVPLEGAGPECEETMPVWKHIMVPEPGSVVALLAGIGGLAGLVLRRRTA